MIKELTLKNGTKSIRFVISYDNYSGGWCELYFHDGSRELKLGANDEETVFSKLMIGFLSLNNRKFFSYSGMEMFTILYVMPHAIIAGRGVDDVLELIFLNTKGEVIPLMCVTDKIKVDWITEIVSFLKTKT